jgi:endonuclease III
MLNQKKIDAIIAYFQSAFPMAETELHYETPYQLIVAVILSAQCTDKRVNQIVPALFERYPTAAFLALASQDEVLALIKSCSYPNNKAKHLIGMAKMLVEKYNEVIPADVVELQKLPGVGRKSANVIASVIYKKEVIAVDTHVFRVAARLGLTENSKTPLETERQLNQHIPKNLLSVAHHWLILHGRYVCIARKPKCETCGLTAFCDYFNLSNSNLTASSLS